MAERTLAEKVASYVGPILLVLVACSQIYLAHVRDLLTPARGGGFGLFSTVDRLRDRELRMYWVGPSGIAQVALPGRPWIVKWIKRATALPSDSHLREIASLMEEVGKPSKIEGSPPFDAARVEVWKHAFDQETLRASRVEVREILVGRSR